MHLGMKSSHGHDCARHSILVFIEERYIMQTDHLEEFNILGQAGKSFLGDMPCHTRLSAPSG